MGYGRINKHTMSLQTHRPATSTCWFNHGCSACDLIIWWIKEFTEIKCKADREGKPETSKINVGIPCRRWYLVCCRVWTARLKPFQTEDYLKRSRGRPPEERGRLREEWQFLIELCVERSSRVWCVLAWPRVSRLACETTTMGLDKQSVTKREEQTRASAHAFAQDHSGEACLFVIEPEMICLPLFEHVIEMLLCHQSFGNHSDS